MIQIRIHGRGGQGVVTAAELLSVAAFVDGRHAQALPAFGPERTGAPVEAYCRIADDPIRLREPVRHPDVIIVQDPTLRRYVDLFAGLAAGGYVLVNSARDWDELGLGEYGERLSRDRTVIVPASQLAVEHTGRLSKRTYLPAGESARVLDALSLLHDVADGGPDGGSGRGSDRESTPRLGRRVAVYGGGNTAMDAARTARRLGATDAVVIYRRTRERMPAHDVEIDEAVEEGVQLRWLSTIVHADAGTITVERMELDETGFPQPTGELERLDADSVVLAIGQDVDRSLVAGIPGLTVTDGVIEVGPDLMTGHPGIFAGGDMVRGEDRTGTTAVGHGKQAARHIDAWLRGAVHTPPPRPGLAGFEQLNTWYYPPAPAISRPRLDPARRVSTFSEVVHGLSEPAALAEARRCLSCGNCFGCDNCYGLCPDDAIRKLEGTGPARYAVDLDYCKGCGICAAECPAGAISMIPEEI